MPKRRKRSLFDEIFGDFEEFFDMPLEGGMGGYSIEIRSTPEGTEVHARVYGNTDPRRLREQLERMYPGAKIVIEGEEKAEVPLIRRESSEHIDEQRERQEGERVSIMFREGRPLIVRDDQPKKEGKDESKESVKIVFRGGKPIIKRVD